MLDFLDTPDRSAKPREEGITHALDDGVGVDEVRDRLEVCEEFVDIVKLGWGTGYVADRLEEKIALYQRRDIPVYFGGTLFEVTIRQGRFDAMVEELSELGVEHVEVSTGVIDLEHEEKCGYVDRLSEEFTVLSEVGRKDADEELTLEEWGGRAEREREAGAWKVIMEGRAGGDTGVYGDDGDVKAGLIEHTAERLGADSIVFEAPQTEQQAWFVERFGPEVNLGNVRLDDVIPLETLRRGLRGDTVETFHPETGVDRTEATTELAGIETDD
ncbi:phosphosulfolactate synthase [Halalkalicoccus tibetensis]|uniref:Phosphosulfolactate synthase n=1 Tax=Halalkalicoccus tibetensis TaxID=175632 RepID=A0ABD5V4X0_9EURY